MSDVWPCLAAHFASFSESLLSLRQVNLNYLAGQLELEVGRNVVTVPAAVHTFYCPRVYLLDSDDDRFWLLSSSYLLFHLSQ
jgi:hypothetical protein